MQSIIPIYHVPFSRFGTWAVVMVFPTATRTSARDVTSPPTSTHIPKNFISSQPLVNAGFFDPSRR